MTNDDDDVINNDHASDNDNDNDNGDKESQMMAKTATATKKAPATAIKKARAKKMGEDIIDINSPPRKKQHAANQVKSYFSTTTLKGYTRSIPIPRGPRT
jgi:hypothetical protein